MSIWPFKKKRTEVSDSGSAAFDSSQYWNARYKTGRNSGAGSYGRLANYKAELINELVAKHSIQSVVEFGSGDGNQASFFTFENYFGVDVVPKVVESCAKRFADRASWSFTTINAYDAAPTTRDMSMSLDVIYHLVEDEVFDQYMRRLFGAAQRYVLVYSSNHDEFSRAVHVRHRKYSDWVAENVPEWVLGESFENPYNVENDGDPENSSFAFFSLFVRSD